MPSFLSIPTIYLLYLFYGGAFLFLSVSIALKDMRASDLKLAKSLWLLAMFGLTHGLHEWLQIYPLLEGELLTVRSIYAVKAAALVLFVVSFLFLLQFGIALVRTVHDRRIRWFPLLTALLFLAWFGYVAYHGFTRDLQFLRQAAIGARHTFGFTGAALTAYGLVIYSREIRQISRSGASMLRSAGITFLLYAGLAGIVSSGFTLFRFPVPVEALRGLSAVLIAYFLIRALNIFDIETRMKLERQSQLMIQSEKLTSLGQLAAGIAHEINTPLTNASLGIQMLKQRIGSDQADRPVLERLEAVEQSIDRAAGIARELLQFSRRQAVAFLPVNINTVVRGALTLLNYKLKSVTVREDLLPVPDLLGDAGKLEQVMINVLSNAVEAMPGGGTIRIATGREGPSVQVRVEDSGCGIAQEDLPRVFDPFYTPKDVGQGTGLGLSICYGIVKQHGGTIEVSSQADRGTTVIMRFPARSDGEKDTDRR